MEKFPTSLPQFHTKVDSIHYRLLDADHPIKEQQSLPLKRDGRNILDQLESAYIIITFPSNSEPQFRGPSQRNVDFSMNQQLHHDLVCHIAELFAFIAIRFADRASRTSFDFHRAKDALSLAQNVYCTYFSEKAPRHGETTSDQPYHNTFIRVVLSDFH